MRGRGVFCDAGEGGTEGVCEYTSSNVPIVHFKESLLEIIHLNDYLLKNERPSIKL